jgi:ribonuclease E
MDKSNKMLIDATHPEETRVVVLRNGRVEEFDYESAARKPLRGNIYLAKVTRVEPSLQAAFVDYGGNRHGFLAFSEIHPDYYQIPVADRQALLAEEAEAEAGAEAEADARAEAAEVRGQVAGGDMEIEPPSRDVHAGAPAEGEPHEALPAQASHSDEIRSEQVLEAASNAEPAASHQADAPSFANGAEQPADSPAGEGQGHVEEISGDQVEAPETLTSVEQVGSEDALEEVPERPRRRMRSYKIQEVIKRRQIILVQVVKEERGSKGAALTTYLSLAGRYTVLMPNTGRGGGISRKITNPQDRKRLKTIAQDLEVPEGMGLIIRTAGAARTKQEIKRDFEYEIRLWENVRDMTLQSTAPCLVYEEGNLIKRSIRDLYSKDIEDILVAGDGAYSEASDFMKMLSPSQAKNVIRYDEPEPLFARFQIERQLNAMFSPYVTLRSGGYLVINQTEALVSIDVNSGKATREFSIEETAHHTNLEAADEIARQLKLRDLAGLIVIDFIDMEEKRNNRAVERRLKEALRFDRARIQVGRISHFGLLEMSRQRLRTGVVEGSTSQCPHCQGTGTVRSTESVALAVLRAIEDQLLRDARSSLTAVTTAEVALYILNNKRLFVTDMEARHGVSITVEASPRMQGANFAIEKSAAPVAAPRAADRPTAVNMEWGFEGQETDEQAGEDVREARSQPEGRAPSAEDEGDGRRPRRRRRRGGRRDDWGDQRERPQQARFSPNGSDVQDTNGAEHGHEQPPHDQDADAYADAGEGAPGMGEQPPGPSATDEGEERRGRRRRRGRRGGRRGRDRNGHPRDEQLADDGHDRAGHEHDSQAHEGDAGSPVQDAHAHEPAHHDRPFEEDTRRDAARAPEPAAEAHGAHEAVHAEATGETRRSPRRATHEGNGSSEQSRPAPVEPAPPAIPQPEVTHYSSSQATSSGTPQSSLEPVQPEPEEPARPARKGWWQRRLMGE